MIYVRVCTVEIEYLYIYITYILTYELVFIHAVDAVQVLSKAAINGNKIHRETSSEAKKSEVASISVLCDYAQV